MPSVPSSKMVVKPSLVIAATESEPTLATVAMEFKPVGDLIHPNAGAVLQPVGDLIHPNAGAVLQPVGDFIHPNAGVVLQPVGDLTHPHPGSVFEPIEPSIQPVTGMPIFSPALAAGQIFAPAQAVVTIAQPIALKRLGDGFVPVTSIFADRIRVGDIIIGLDRFLAQPKPRGKMTVPVSPSPQVNAATVFEDPAVPSKKYCLPLFLLGEQIVDGQSRLRVVLEKVDLAWRLTVRFSTGVRVQGAEPLSFTLSAVLRFVSPAMDSVTKEKTLRVEQEDAITWKATLVMETITERDEVYNALTQSDYRTQLVLRCAIRVALPESKTSPTAEQLYKEAALTVEAVLDRDPFRFDPTLHAYIFRGIIGVSGGDLGFILRQVSWKGRNHHYFQDEANLSQFYYLPDEVKVTRHPDAPFTPNLLVKFASADGSLEKMQASLEYVAAPVLDSDRLAAAAQVLKAHLPTGATGPVVFQPLVVSRSDQIKLSLALPGAAASTSLHQDRPGIATNLTDSFADVIAGLALPQFQEAYDALFGKSAVILTGGLSVGGEGQRPDESIPFAARLNDLHGQVLEEGEIADTDGTVRVTLRNRCESTVVLRSMPAEILAGGQAFPARVQNLAGSLFQFPVRLAPEQEVALRVVANQPLPTGSTPDALYDLDDLVVEPDTDAVWQAILDASVPAQYSRTITVMAVAEWFAPTTDVLAIAVELRMEDT